jgi:hypothetical protein
MDRGKRKEFNVKYPLTFVKRGEIKKQVVETTCGSHEKTSVDSL